MCFSLGDVTQDLLVQRAEAQAAAGEAVARLQKHRNIMDQMLTVSVHTVVCLPGETDPALGHRPPRGSARALLVAAREKAQHPSQPWAEPDIAEGEEGDVFTDEELEELQVQTRIRTKKSKECPPPPPRSNPPPPPPLPGHLFSGANVLCVPQGHVQGVSELFTLNSMSLWKWTVMNRYCLLVDTNLLP